MTGLPSPPAVFVLDAVITGHGQHQTTGIAGIPGDAVEPPGPEVIDGLPGDTPREKCVPGLGKHALVGVGRGHGVHLHIQAQVPRHELGECRANHVPRADEANGSCPANPVHEEVVHSKSMLLPLAMREAHLPWAPLDDRVVRRPFSPLNSCSTPVSHGAFTRSEAPMGRIRAMSLLAILPLLAPPSQDGPSHLGAYHHTIGDLERPTAVAFLDETRLAVAGPGGVRLFTHEGEPIESLELDLVEPTALALVGSRILIADGRRGLIAVETDGSIGRHLDGGELASTGGVACSGNRVAVTDPIGGRVLLAEASDQESALSLESVTVIPTAGRPVDVLFEGADLLVLDSDGHEVIRHSGEPPHRATASLGGFGFPPGLFAAPRGMALAGDELFVADTENHRVQVFDPELITAGVPPLRQAPRYWVGQHAIVPREGEGKLHYPADVAVSPDGEWLAICEPLDDRVQVFERAAGARPEVDPLRAAGGQASPHYGHHMAVEGACMVIVEPETHRLLIHDLRQLDAERRNDPIEISFAGGYGDRLGLFRGPAGLDLDLESNGRLVVCDPASHRVQELALDFDPERELAQDFRLARAVREVRLDQVSREIGSTELAWAPRPVDVARATTGELFVLDEANACVLVLGPDLLPRRVLAHEALAGPREIALSRDGTRLFVTEEHGRRVRVMTTGDGAVIDVLGTDRLAAPAGIVVADDGRVWVTDLVHCAVFGFAADGTPSGRFGSQGLARDELYRPRGLGLSGEGELIVIDHGNHRGLVLDEGLGFIHAFGSRLYTRPALRPDRYPPEDYDR